MGRETSAATSAAATATSDEELLARHAGEGYQAMDPISATVEVAASAGDVWAAISPPGNLINIHPFCERNEISVWDGARSRDHVYYYSGVHYQREFCDWFDGVGYDLVLGPAEARTALVRWRIDERDGGSEFSITAVALLRDDVPAAQREHYAEHMIRRPLPSYLDSVVRGTAYFAETGTPVTKNQFGTHPIYSPED